MKQNVISIKKVDEIFYFDVIIQIKVVKDYAPLNCRIIIPSLDIKAYCFNDQTIGSVENVIKYYFKEAFENDAIVESLSDWALSEIDGVKKYSKDVEQSDEFIYYDFSFEIMKSKITEDLFWNIIETVSNESTGNIFEFEKNIIKRLTEFTKDEIIELHIIFAKLIKNIYTREIWDILCISNFYCSDDTFLYFRAWLISKGKDVYYSVLKDPDSFADFDFADIENSYFDALLFVFDRAYKKKIKDAKIIPRDILYFLGLDYDNQYALTGEETLSENFYKVFPKTFKKYFQRYSEKAK